MDWGYMYDIVCTGNHILNMGVTLKAQWYPPKCDHFRVIFRKWMKIYIFENEKNGYHFVEKVCKIGSFLVLKVSSGELCSYFRNYDSPVHMHCY